MRISDWSSDVCSSDLLMVTIGVGFFLEGFGQMVFGSNVYNIDIGMPKDPIFILEGVFDGGVLIDSQEMMADLIAALLVMARSEEHTSELQSLMSISYAVFCLKKKK